jgi:hypothetical protein
VKEPIDKIRGLCIADRTALRSKQINSAQEFWKAMANDPRLLDGLGLPDEAARKRVATSLAALAKKQSESVTKGWFAIHTPALAVVAAVLLLVAAVVFRDRSPELVAREGFGAFHVITASDVEGGSAGTQAQKALSKVIGRYATQPTAKGASIDPSKLSPGPPLSRELDGLRIFSIKLQATPLLENIRPPTKLAIILAHVKDNESSVVIHDVYVLDLHLVPDGVWAVVAATDCETEQISSLLSQGAWSAVALAH